MEIGSETPPTQRVGGIEFLGADFEECYVCTGLAVAEENVMIPSTYNGLRVVLLHDIIWSPKFPLVSLVSIFRIRFST